MPRGLGIALLATLVLAPSAAAELRIYSSLPLQGSLGPQSRDIVLAMRMALQDRGGRAGDHAIDYVSLDDSSRESGLWEPQLVAENAARAAGDRLTIAYLGEFNSGASAISIPFTNEARILQVSPSNTYVGLTRAEGAFDGEPDKYYPAGIRSYGRVAPADHLQADAIATQIWQTKLKRVFVVHDREVYGRGLARLVSKRLRQRSVRIAGTVGLDTKSSAAGLRRLARRIRRARPDAFFFGGITENRAPELFDAVHRASPRLRLFGPDGVADGGFTRRITSATAARTYITAAPLAASAYSAAGRDFHARFRAAHGRAPQTYAIFGYEAMAVALDSIDRARPIDAGAEGRSAVLGAFFATRDRDSVLGRYSIDSNGDTTLSTYGGYRVRRGRLRFDRVIDSFVP